MAPHLLVPCTDGVRHSLVVYSGTVDIIILLVFFGGNASFLFLRTLTWRGGLFVFYLSNQLQVQFISPLPSIPLYHSVLWVNLWGGRNVLWIGILIQSRQLPGWNMLDAICVSINLEWVHFVHFHVLIYRSSSNCCARSPTCVNPYITFLISRYTHQSSVDFLLIPYSLMTSSGRLFSFRQIYLYRASGVFR